MISPGAREALLGTAFLAGVDENASRILFDAGREQAHRAGSDLFRQGSDPTGLHLLISGRVKVWRSNEQGASLTLHMLAPGALIGCVAVLRQMPYPGTATAVEASSSAVFPRAALAEALHASQTLTNNALTIVSERSALFVERLQEAATESVEARVAHTLLRLSTAQAGALVLTRQEVADLTGTSLHMVSRLFAHWSRLGLVETGRRRVAVLDPAGLTNRARNA